MQKFSTTKVKFPEIIHQNLKLNYLGSVERYAITNILNNWIKVDIATGEYPLPKILETRNILSFGFFPDLVTFASR
jgi:hypothetical protein